MSPLEGWRAEPKVHLLNLAYDLTPAGGWRRCKEGGVGGAGRQAAALAGRLLAGWCCRAGGLGCLQQSPACAGSIPARMPASWAVTTPRARNLLTPPPPLPYPPPPDVVSVVVTEMGAVPPSSVAVILREAQRDASASTPL